MKLPIILSAMIAALAIPGSIASEATSETATQEATTDAAAPDAAAAPEATKAAPKAKAKGKKGSGEHHKGGHKHKKRAHHDDSAGNTSGDPYKGSYDDNKLQRADGYPSEDYSPKAGQMEVPGQKTP